MTHALPLSMKNNGIAVLLLLAWINLACWGIFGTVYVCQHLTIYGNWSSRSLSLSPIPEWRQG